MPAITMVAARAGAGVGKPPREEIASGGLRWFSELYGDLAAASGVSNWPRDRAKSHRWTIRPDIVTPYSSINAHQS